MAFKSKARPRRRFARKSKSHRKSNNRVVIHSGALNPFPKNLVTKFRYVTDFIQTGGSGIDFVQWAFRLNSLYDPDYTGGGHQPMGYDQLTTIYNRYRVISCAYELSGLLYDSSTGVQRDCIITANPRNGTTFTPTDVSDAMEQPRCRSVRQADTGPTKVLRGKLYLPSIVGRTKAQYMADDVYQAANNQNPSEDIQMLCSIWNSSTSTGNTLKVRWTVKLTFWAELFDQNNLNQS